MLRFAATWEAAIGRAWDRAIEALAAEIDAALRARRADAAGDEADLRRIFAQVSSEQDRAMRRALPGVAIPDVVSGGSRLQDRWVRRNVDLIKVDAEVKRTLREFLERPLREGLSQRELAAQLAERFAIGKRRAQLIARDQTLKLAGQLAEERQTQVGIRRYVWTTSGDERVRDDHAELDGTVQEWDDPPITNASEVRRGRPPRREHPGGDYQCRCTAEPILDDDAPEERDAPEPREPEPQPAPEPPGVPEPAPTPGPSVAAVDRLAERARIAAEQRAARLAREAAARAPVATQAAVVRAPAHAPAPLRAAAEASAQRLRSAMGPLQPAAIELADTGLGARVYGNYASSRGVVAVSFREETLAISRRARLPYAAGARPGNISDFATSDAEHVAITTTHELAHHVHFQASQRAIRLGERATSDAGDAVNDLILREYHSPAREYVSEYAQSFPWEYFAEAFAAYHHLPPEWRTSHPRATRLVEAVLRLRGGAP